MARLTVDDVSISFPLYHGESRSLKKTVMAAASGRLGQDNKHRLTVEALKNISFSLNSGDRVGFIGCCANREGHVHNLLFQLGTNSHSL
jgi:lipopolysaccharide transport system ATP-binding protein